MPIYTRKGDAGDAHRPGGRRVRKSDALLEALGSLDEFNAHLGWCLQCAAGAVAQAKRKRSGRGEGKSLGRTPITDTAAAYRDIIEALTPLQGELMAMGALLAAAGRAGDPGVSLDPSAVARMEKQIDAAWAALPELRHFILPGGGEMSCRLHVARTVCRRAERRVVAAVDAGAPAPSVVLQHLNRMSDLLFAMARLADHAGGEEDRLWTPKKKR
jgi:cob(I)alamin adenosyltransferase